MVGPLSKCGLNGKGGERFVFFFFPLLQATFFGVSPLNKQTQEGERVRVGFILN